MAIYKIRCKLTFKKLKIGTLGTFAIAVKNGFYGNNPPFIVIPIPEATFEALIVEYNTKYSAYDNGGEAQKGAYEEALDNLIAALVSISDEVNLVAQNNPNTIMLAGFEPTKGSSSSSVPPVQPTGVTMEQGISGQLLAECPKVPGANFYGGILVAGEPIPDYVSMNAAGQLIAMDDEDQASGAAVAVVVPQIRFIFDVNKSRKKKFMNLQKGTLYYLYYYAGNAKGVSPLSDVVIVECIK